MKDSLVILCFAFAAVLNLWKVFHLHDWRHSISFEVAVSDVVDRNVKVNTSRDFILQTNVKDKKTKTHKIVHISSF